MALPTSRSNPRSAPPPSTSRVLPRGAALAVAALAAAGCAAKEKAPPAPPVPEVAVVEVIQRDVPVGGELTATLRGFEDVEIRVRVEGYLKSIDYREGTEVKKGQLLFTIDDLPYRAKLAETKGDLARAHAALSKADMDVSRYRPLAAERAVSQAELDNALAAQMAGRAQVEAAKANVEKAALDLGYTRMAAPLAGLAGQAQHKVGDLVGKGEPTLLTTISSIDPIRVSVNIPEALYLRQAGRRKAAPAGAAGPRPPDSPKLWLADGSLYPERGRLIFVDRAIDPQTGTLRADLAFANPKRLLRPGLYGRVRYWEELRPGALLVPQRAVQELQGQYSVIVVSGEGKAESRRVRTGVRVDGLWLLEEGVKPGEKVIVEGVQKVQDGMSVKATVVPGEHAPAQPAAGAAPGATGAATDTAPAASR